jgi:TetR/AcrR family fatty acid metabolism transcriptional regulator
MKRKNSEEKKSIIIAAAEDLIAQKGLNETKISEISSKIGIADSVIYQHFKSKQELLFEVVYVRLKEVLSLLHEHLQGIQDAKSLLTKMVWFHLRYNDSHPGYARTLLFDSRSSNEFYQSPAYNLIKSYSGILQDIITKGVENGEFCSDLNTFLVRDIVLGTLDAESISCLAGGEIDESVHDFEEIMSLVLPMITHRSEDQASKSERILKAAEKVFAEKGFTKATVLEIARLAHVAEGTVYEYFENKEDLLFSIALDRLQYNLDKLPETFEIKNPLRKLRRLIKYYISLFLRDREFLQVFLFQIQLNQRFYTSKAFRNYRSFYRVLEDLIDEGKAGGYIRSDVNPRIFRNMFLGAFSHVALRWIFFQEKSEFDKMQEIEQMTDLLMAAIMREDLNLGKNNINGFD